MTAASSSRSPPRSTLSGRRWWACAQSGLSHPTWLHDKVSRAIGILRNARTITSEETMHLLSSVRLGINLGLIEGIEIPTINELFIHTQPAHLQMLSRTPLESSDRNAKRTSYIRQRLGVVGEGDADE